MAKVLLVSVNDVNAEGLRMLSAILRQNGHQPYIAFLQRNGFPYSHSKKYVEAGREVEEYDWTGIDVKGNPFRMSRGPDLTVQEQRLFLLLIDRINPDLIGFTVTQPFERSIGRLSRLIRDRFTIPIIWGGAGPTSGPRRFSQWCEFVCVGEGDRAIVDMAARIDNGEDLREAENIAYFQDGEFVRNPLHPLVGNLDELPFKDILPDNKFLIDDDRLTSHFGVVSYSENGRYHTTTARGCPYSCAYCSEGFLKSLYAGQKYLRRRSPSHVIEELVEAKKIVDYRAVQFEDEVFSLNLEWLEEFVDMYRERIRVPFECYIYPSNVIERQLKLLKKGGLFETCLALQSGSDRINRDVFKRHFDKKLYLETANILRGLDISYYVDVITYNPFETREDLQATLHTLLQLPGHFPLCVNKLYLMEGSAMHASVLESKDATDTDRVADSEFRYYSRLFHAAAICPKRIVYLAHRAKIFEYSPFLLMRLFFRLGALARRVKRMPKAAVAYVSLLRRFPSMLHGLQLGVFHPPHLEPSKLVQVEGTTRFFVDSINGRLLNQLTFYIVINPQIEKRITITGWALDQKAGTTAGGVFININGQRDIPAHYGIDRPAVALFLDNNKYRFSGFSASFHTSVLNKGHNIIALKIVTADTKGYYARGQKITIDVR